MWNKIDWIAMWTALPLSIASAVHDPHARLAWICCTLWIIKSMLEKSHHA